NITMASSLLAITTAANSNIDKDYVITSIDEISDDVIKYANDRFYNFVEEVSEDIIKDLLKYEDEEIEFIKQKCFYKDNDQYKLKLGIEREISKLLSLLKDKAASFEEEKDKKKKQLALSNRKQQSTIASSSSTTKISSNITSQ
ncbi:unnamed protein product, partial [Didymodactylos carnosus]